LTIWFYCDVAMMFYVVKSISCFNIIAYYLAQGLPERQPHRAVRTTAARNMYCEKLTSRRIGTCGEKKKNFFR